MVDRVGFNRYGRTDTVIPIYNKPRPIMKLFYNYIKLDFRPHQGVILVARFTLIFFFITDTQNIEFGMQLYIYKYPENLVKSNKSRQEISREDYLCHVTGIHPPINSI